MEGILTNSCSTCLSTDRDLIHINNFVNVYQVFKLLLFERAADRLGEIQDDIPTYVCWECHSLLKKFGRFKKQVQNAQSHLRIVAMSTGQEGVDNTFLPNSLSSLDVSIKHDYDKIFFEYTTHVDWDEAILMANTTEQQESIKSERLDVAQNLRENIHFEPIRDATGVPTTASDLVLQTPASGLSHILIREVSSLEDNFILEGVEAEEYDITPIKGELEYSTIELGPAQVEAPTLSVKKQNKEQKCGYTTEYMSEEAMLASREEMKLRVTYASAVYKCELCILGFYNQQQVEDHFVSLHRGKPGLIACKVCYCYMEEKKLGAHHDTHYLRYECKLCTHVEYGSQLIMLHVKSHLESPVPSSVIMIGDTKPTKKMQSRKKKIGLRQKQLQSCKPGDLRKLLSKKTIEGYQCLECDTFFKNSRARKNHVLRFHREGLQCDHCKKRFVNRTTLLTHMKLHEGPLPRSECPICHKQVRVIQLKYHIQRHNEKGCYECEACKKVFSYLSTYQAHLKYSRAHASDEVFKFPCPMCNKGYPTKVQMQDHFNYQHLGKTAHKCPICDKPIASRINVDRHMNRVHGEKKEKPKTHVCLKCGKAFRDKKALNQHEVIHSGDRPLVCELCHQTFKQKASLYTHKKRVHKVAPAKKVVEFMGSTGKASTEEIYTNISSEKQI